MAKFIKGDVVVVPFPFSDLTQTKRRPALVISTLEESNDLILCQITSKNIKDNISISLNNEDFQEGSLKQPSNIRPNRIFTADSNLILYRIGNIKEEKLKEVIEKIIEVISS